MPFPINGWNLDRPVERLEVCVPDWGGWREGLLRCAPVREVGERVKAMPRLRDVQLVQEIAHRLIG